MSDTLPPLPAAPVDFNALHDALEAGDAGRIALEKAVASAAGEPIPEYPTTSGKTTKQLEKIARDEGVTLHEDMTNDERAEAIETARRGAPLVVPAAPEADPETDTAADREGAR